MYIRPQSIVPVADTATRAYAVTIIGAAYITSIRVKH